MKVQCQTPIYIASQAYDTVPVDVGTWEDLRACYHQAVSLVPRSRGHGQLFSRGGLLTSRGHMGLQIVALCCISRSPMSLPTSHWRVPRSQAVSGQVLQQIGMVISTYRLSDTYPRPDPILNGHRYPSAFCPLSACRGLGSASQQALFGMSGFAGFLEDLRSVRQWLFRGFSGLSVQGKSCQQRASSVCFVIDP